MSEVSMYANNRDTKGFAPCFVSDIYEFIRSGVWDVHANPVRSLEYGSKEYKAQKDKTPAFTTSGVFVEGNRTSKGLVVHSGRIAIDVDGIHDSLLDIKDALMQDDYVEAVCLSVGGGGLAVFMKIDPSKFLESFLALEQYFLNDYGITIDKSCKNVDRLRYVTSDPDIYINMESKVFEIPEDNTAELFDNSFLPAGYNAPNSVQFDDQVKNSVSKEVIRRCVRIIEDAQKGGVHHAILKAGETAGGYVGGGLVDESEVVQALLNAALAKPNSLKEREELKKITDGVNHGKTRPIKELMVEQKSIFTGKSPEAVKALKEVFLYACQVNREGRDYTPNDVMHLSQQFDSIEGVDMVEVEKVFEHVKKTQKEYFNWDSKSSVEKVEIHINKNWDLRYNVVKNSVDCKTKEKSKFEPLKIENIYRNLQHNRLKYNMSDLKSLLNSDFVDEYDPFKNYFENLPAWDGVDYIGMLAKHITVKKQAFFEQMFKKHLVRSVKCSLGEGVNRFIFTIAGSKQSTGKTYFLRWICPFKDDYYTESSIDSKSKDTKIAMAKNFFYNIDELASLNKNDIDSLKSLVSIDTISERLPYGSTAVTMKRRGNFLASTNNLDFLVDIENTRWLVFEVESINRAYSKDIDIHKVWAQAYALYKDANFDDQLSKEESDIQNSDNKDFNYSSTEEELIKKHFKVVSRTHGAFYSTTDIMHHLSSRYPTFRLNNISMGRAMSICGFEAGRKKVNEQYQRGYFAEMIEGVYKDVEPENLDLFTKKKLF